MVFILSKCKILTVIFVTFYAQKSLAIICYKCDSINFSDCATSLDSTNFPTEECKNAYMCASSIVDEVTYRGCSTNTPHGPEYYKTCSENLCNKGVYPPGRLKCHQCSGNGCATAPEGKPTPCLYFHETDYCYTDVIDEIDTFRGCSSDTNRTPNILAELCEINGCNDLPGVTTLTCSKCDSNEGRGCKMDLFQVNNATCVITNDTTCSNNALLGHEQPSCFLYLNLDHVVRGCTSDSGILSLDMEHFDTCATDLCNKNCLKQQKCIECDSTTNESCKSDPESLKAITCPSPETSSCNVCELPDGTVQRGCGVPSITSDMHCDQCQGEACNKDLQLTKCYKCSSDDNPNCSQWTNTDAISVENCEESGADCISAVLKNGSTLRGCESPWLKCNNTQSSCVTCSESFCNAGIFPAPRLQCYHCDGKYECSDSGEKLPCVKYDQNDACFEFISGRNTMVRGCRSDESLYFECLLAGTNCRLCTESGCNMSPLNEPAKLHCHKCSKSGEHCSWQQTNETLVACRETVQFLSKESCFIRYHFDGTTSRGCSLDNSQNEKEQYLEQNCSDDGCNNKSVIIQKCIQCRGSIESGSDCFTKINMVEGNICKNGSIEYQERGCYIRTAGEFIERGCASDFNVTELDNCRHSDDCFYCYGPDCNSVTNLTFTIVRNSNSRILAGGIFIYLILATIIVLRIIF